MSSIRGIASFTTVCPLFLPVPAAAELKLGVRAGGAAATPTGAGAVPLYRWNLRAGVGWAWQERHSAALRLRLQGCPTELEHHTAGNVTLTYRIRTNMSEAVEPFLGISVGAGMWNGCMRGDWCGGADPVGERRAV